MKHPLLFLQHDSKCFLQSQAPATAIPQEHRDRGRLLLEIGRGFLRLRDPSLGHDHRVVRLDVLQLRGPGVARREGKAGEPVEAPDGTQKVLQRLTSMVQTAVPVFPRSS